MGAVASDPAAFLFAAHPELLAPVLRIIHRVIASFLLKETGLKRSTADTGAVSLERMKGSNGHREWEFSPYTARLTACRAGDIGDIVAYSEKGRLEFPIRPQ